jgi:hypothetical protein
MRRYASILVAVGCGNDHALVDAGDPPGSPVVSVTSPRTNQSFYPSETVSVVWTATDDDSTTLMCAVAAESGSGSIVIMPSITVASSQTGTASWALAGVPQASDYRVHISCTDGNGLVGNGLSGPFSVSAPARAVPYTDVQAIFTASCNSMQCHDATAPQGGLNLTAASSYAELYDQPSGDCPATKLVKPGSPNESYLMHKLEGSGPCFVGTRMPKTMPALAADKLQTVRDWISSGAPP